MDRLAQEVDADDGVTDDHPRQMWTKVYYDRVHERFRLGDHAFAPMRFVYGLRGIGVYTAALFTSLKDINHQENDPRLSSIQIQSKSEVNSTKKNRSINGNLDEPAIGYLPRACTFDCHEECSILKTCFVTPDPPVSLHVSSLVNSRTKGSVDGLWWLSHRTRKALGLPKSQEWCAKLDTKSDDSSQDESYSVASLTNFDNVGKLGPTSLSPRLSLVEVFDLLLSASLV
ncbi:hypothetical protein NM208_g6080 [Fusarium decemcellulare]|uniref:Uncharacterized protein n=1 Tax=Fusarium decemcellulare TaxID=57161 RepID=A0ACC1SER9_9HYPO|nr:hypothetical protein NM208_g6080 [Fusarium decemcellulare]